MKTEWSNELSELLEWRQSEKGTSNDFSELQEWRQSEEEALTSLVSYWRGRQSKQVTSGVSERLKRTVDEEVSNEWSDGEIDGITLKV